MDVWGLIYNLLDTPGDVLSLMYTCARLYATGIPALLGLPVILTDIPELKLFCDFVLADDGRRPGLVCKLRVAIELPRLGDGDQGSEDNEELHRLIPDFARVLAGTSRLELAIGFAEELLQRGDVAVARGICPPDLRLSDVLASLHSVTDLKVASYGPLTASLLRTMSSRPAGVDIKFYDAVRRGDPNTYHNFCEALSSHQDTLRWVRVWDAQMGGPLSRPQPDAPRFSLVRHLMLVKVLWPSLPVLLHSFPDLQFLDITCPSRMPISLDNEVKQAREVNLAAPSDTSWPSFQLLAGDLYALYVLGVRGSIWRMEIGQLDVCDVCVEMLEAVLEDLSPSHLCLHVGYTDGRVPIDHQTNLVVLLQQVSRPLEITHLQLNVRRDILVTAGLEEERLNLVRNSTHCADDFLSLTTANIQGLIGEAILPFARLRNFMLYVSRDEDMILHQETLVTCDQLSRYALRIAMAQPELEFLHIDAYFAENCAWTVERTPTSTTLVRMQSASEFRDRLGREDLLPVRRPRHTRPTRFVADWAGTDEFGFDDREQRNLAPPYTIANMCL